MNVSGLSRDNVASHLQKYRLGLKRDRFGRKRKELGCSGPKAKVPRRDIGDGCAQLASQQDAPSGKISCFMYYWQKGQNNIILSLFEVSAIVLN
jgi:hypothetical protein